MNIEETRTRVQQILYQTLSPFGIFSDIWVGVGMTADTTSVTVYCGPDLLIARTVLSAGKSPHSIVSLVVDLDGPRLIRQIEDWMHGSRAQVGDEALAVSKAILLSRLG